MFVNAMPTWTFGRPTGTLYSTNLQYNPDCIRAEDCEKLAGTELLAGLIFGHWHALDLCGLSVTVVTIFQVPLCTTPLRALS